VKALLLSLAAFTLLFAALIPTGVYNRIESVLDLKYNSPFVLIPLYGFIALSGICFFIGFLLYYYKYKRSRSKGTFQEAFSKIISDKPIGKD